MEFLKKYKNGNYFVKMYSDGTKIRYTKEDTFESEFPENIDIKITNYCDLGCKYCHENSTKEGKHGNINLDFINTLRPGTELAIGGGNVFSHPQLEEFLLKLKELEIISNITVNQKHFIDNFERIKKLRKDGLIYGIGVSLASPTEDLKNKMIELDNCVLHVINGVVTYDELKSLYNPNLKILFLGYKYLRRGIDFFSTNETDIISKQNQTKEKMDEILKNFKVVSFDNKAVKDLEIKNFLTDEEYDKFYMGDDGQFTMYIDLVEEEYALNSTSLLRKSLTNDIITMFEDVKGQH